MSFQTIEYNSLINANAQDFWLHASKNQEIWQPWPASEESDEETTEETTEETSLILMPLMLHDIKASSFNYSTLDNRAISKSELYEHCFKDGVLEKSGPHSPVYISDIHSQYLNIDLVEPIPSKKMSKFTSPNDNNLSDHWAERDFAIREFLNPPKTWTEWALSLFW